MLIVTDYCDCDYSRILRESHLVVDIRAATRGSSEQKRALLRRVVS